MVMEKDPLEHFFDKVRAEHSTLGVKKEQYMLNEADLSEVWERFAKSADNVITGKNSVEIQQRLSQLAASCIYVHEYMQREDGKTTTRKIAEARQKRQMAAVQARKVG